ncbi:MATE family efflux transporter [Pseudooceanicola sp. LIPI14-2-Ac024]|uniref:MATE family efflux transporter n=1 Tax=Pseudooceanicola sp. LIPI14-2-Ac024 TaxID=3344875 RepID=UPI0035D0212A
MPNDLSRDRRMARTRAMLEAPVAPTLGRMAAPNVIGMVATTFISVAEGIWASRLGIDALAAVALVFPFVMLTQTLAGGAFGGSTSAAVARALGAGDEDRAGRVAFHALLIALGMGALMAAVFIPFGAPIFALLGGEGNVLQLALAWGAVYFPGAALVWLSQISASLMRGTGNMLLPSLSLLGISALAPLFSGAFALGWGPFPSLGVPGLALGFLCSHAIVSAVLLVYFARGGLGFAIFADLRPALKFATPILKVASIAALSPVQTILTTLVVTGFVARYGAEALAGYGLGARLEFLMIPVSFGFGAAATAMVGTNIGAGQVARARAVAWTAALMAGACTGLIGLTVAIAPDLWLGMFLGPEPSAVRDAATGYLTHVAPFYAFMGFGLALYFASQGAGKVLLPVLAVTGRLAIATAGCALAVRAGLPLEWLFWAIAAAMVGYGIFAALAVKLARWQPDRVPDAPVKAAA